MKKITKTVAELQDLFSELNSIASQEAIKKAPHFNYGLIRNVKLMTNLIDDFKKTSKDTLGEYFEKLGELQKEYGTKDEKGELIIKNNNVVFDKDALKEFNIKTAELRVTYKKALDADTDFLKSEETIELREILLDTIPEGLISGRQMFILDDLIIENL